MCINPVKICFGCQEIVTSHLSYCETEKEHFSTLFNDALPKLRKDTVIRVIEMNWYFKRASKTNKYWS